ncbi:MULTISPECIES: NAD(P)/FAD-dependent oxidoreductase [Hyphobacterium]|uniref:NAD(P)/FAD-dependent oxidoreductase n=1 Tax=Hyphobacterium vulgare TaxID=1736751 RepID=A0ABV6ZZS6_9PROT
METYGADAVVVGAGVIGLAIARALARRGRDVVVLEAQPRIGSVTSARNSEVIHAGIYYPETSLKVRTCVAGRRALYAFLETRGIPHRKCGKLIVALSDGEVPAIEALHARGTANGVEGLERVSAASARTLEPALSPGVRAALVSPETGILDSHAFMAALQGELEDAGGRVALSTPFERAEKTPDGFDVFTGGLSAVRLRCRTLVNAAGLGSEAIARSIEGLDPAHIPVLRYARGRYFTAPGRCPFQRLIYPAPVEGGLGTHLTFDLGGAMRFGPDVEWIDAPDGYAVDPALAPDFEAAARRFWPGARPGSFQPGYAGIRPKLSGPGEPAADFRIDGPDSHGIAGLVCLHGIESPGLTASLALADVVASCLGVE